MATVILSAVGTFVGGPIGGALGTILGQKIDGAILGSGKPREGPRIKELDVQTSSYGTQIPAIFGAMRVAGTVIWSTDLIERRAKSGSGKNRPATVNYSYSANFAVALSSRPIARIGRIWADGNLLRGAAGDFKSETVYRFHSGHGDQPLDPLLASAETIGHSPAYRGVAYVVFEEFQLADFGNRIPSLTFEIFERETPVLISDIMSVSSAGVIAGQSAVTLTGFAVQGSDCRSALLPLIATLPIIVRTAGGSVALSDWSAATANHVVLDSAASDGTDRIERPMRMRHSHSRAPATLSIRHYEPDRDFQAGVQISRSMGANHDTVQIDLPAAIGSGAARALADLNVLQRWRGLNGYKAALPIAFEAVRAGDHVVLAESSAPLRITEVEHQRGSIRIVATEWVDDVTTNLIADPGRNLSGSDRVIGETRLVIADLPAMGSDDPGRAMIAVGAAGTGAGWKRAALTIMDGDREIELGATKGIATIGHLVGALPAHSALLEDRANQPVIRLLHDGMTLPVGAGDPMAFDSPLLWIGGELVRYGSAEKIGARDYRLTQLLRGCIGSSSQVLHPDQTDVVVMDSDSLLLLDSIPAPLGSNVTVHALGLGDAEPVEAVAVVTGNAIRPPKPVHGTVVRQADGATLLQWKSRDRRMHNWSDGADIPNSEGFVEFALDLRAEGIRVASWTVSSHSLLLAPAEFTALAIPEGAALQFSIVQQGRFARSLPLLLTGTAAFGGFV